MEFYSLMNTTYYWPLLSNTEGTAKWKEGDPFTNVKGNNYWISTTTVGETAGAWLVEIYITGKISQQDETTGAGLVWPVREGK